MAGSSDTKGKSGVLFELFWNSLVRVVVRAHLKVRDQIQDYFRLDFHLGSGSSEGVTDSGYVCFGQRSQPGQTQRVNSGSQLSRSTRLTLVNSVKQHEVSTRRVEYCRTHASKSSLGNDITKSYIASFAQEYSGEFITPPFHCFTFCKCFRGGKTCTFCKAYKNYIFLNHFTSKLSHPQNPPAEHHRLGA
ncbi:hypothetical protein HanHA300_Chr16g0611231 [Helianthus annuus]|nr:hypothetical protein HanHA300_Chr16g0611231 [Helianthus annuus]KAJ0460528.1 hypothetical protein HanHA89_Chr16g0661831 [Helianthus annuus]